MQRRLFLAAAAVTTMLATSTHALAADAKPVELFGTPLKGASRDQLRTAIKAVGLQPEREDDRYWIDKYDVNGALEGATKMLAAYVGATRKFAYVEYTLPSRMDTKQIGRIVKMVSTKYGRPSSQSGNFDLGDVSVKWNLGQGIQLEVLRGWPDTTTYMRYSDSANYKQMRAEIEANEEADTAAKAKAQSKAF